MKTMDIIKRHRGKRVGTSTFSTMYEFPSNRAAVDAYFELLIRREELRAESRLDMVAIGKKMEVFRY